MSTKQIEIVKWLVGSTLVTPSTDLRNHHVANHQYVRGTNNIVVDLFHFLSCEGIHNGMTLGDFHIDFCTNELGERQLMLRRITPIPFYAMDYATEDDGSYDHEDASDLLYGPDYIDADDRNRNFMEETLADSFFERSHD